LLLLCHDGFCLVFGDESHCIHYNRHGHGNRSPYPAAASQNSCT
jgi:hypothetical protein